VADPFIQRMYDKLKTDPFHNKILLCSSFAQGHQWLEQACRTCGPVMNTEVQTLDSVVLAAVKYEITAQGLSFVSESETFWIVLQLLEQLTAVDESYLPQTMLTPGVVQSFHKAITELRYAGVTGANLRPDSFENTAKGPFIQNLLMSYETYLSDHKLMDYAGLLPLINDKNRNGEWSVPFQRGFLFIILR
jgi:ATP-dependent helicase/nuclease subunit B